MVIQYACPRFSRMTLSVSVIICPTRSFVPPCDH
jgi:hypothetical protein